MVSAQTFTEWNNVSVPFPFSSKTVGYMVEAIVSGHTASSMGTLFLKAEVDRWEPDAHKNKEDRAQQLLQFLRYEKRAANEAVAGAMELARLLLTPGKPDRWQRGAEWYEPLRMAIAADGWEFDVDTDSVVTTVPGMQVVAEVTWIGDELRRRGWTTAAGHYQQAVESFADGRWASANGQLRSFYERLVREAGGTTGASGSGQVQAAVDNLNAASRLITNEADFAKRLWSMLHPAGSHPGLSDEDESRFRLLALTGYARFLLGRLP